MAARIRTLWLAGAVAAACAYVAPDSSEARMTVIYDVGTSVDLLLGTQPDGSAGLAVADGIFQQQPGPVILPAERQVGKVSGGAGSALTPDIKPLSAAEMVALFIARVDAADAHIMFVDELGQGPAFAGVAGTNLASAMATLQSLPSPYGGSYAERIHMYVNPAQLVADPVAWGPLWDAMARSGGVWFEGYQGREQWSAEHWLSWPRRLRTGLLERGMDPARMHVIVRGVGQSAIWSHMRTGAACALLANGPGAYRTEDHAGFVREFRATFGTSAAPAGPSPVTCNPTPVIPQPRAGRLAGVLAWERTGAPSTGVSLARRFILVRRTTRLAVTLGADPLGIAARLGVGATAFWGSAGASLRATGPGIDVAAPIPAGGKVVVPLSPSGPGVVSLRLQVPGTAVRVALGPPADLEASLGVYRPQIGSTLDRMIAHPVDWNLDIPINVALRAVREPRLSFRVLSRRAAPRRSVVELRLSHSAGPLRIDLSAVRRGVSTRIGRVRVAGTRAVIRVPIPAGARLRARIL